MVGSVEIRVWWQARLEATLQNWALCFSRGLEEADDHWVVSYLKAHTLTGRSNVELQATRGLTRQDSRPVWNLQNLQTEHFPVGFCSHRVISHFSLRACFLLYINTATIINTYWVITVCPALSQSPYEVDDHISLIWGPILDSILWLIFFLPTF